MVRYEIRSPFLNGRTVIKINCDTQLYEPEKPNKPPELTWGYWAVPKSIDFNINFNHAGFVGIKIPGSSAQR